jgi:protein TonB
MISDDAITMRGELLRWTGCAVLAVALHVAGAAALLAPAEEADEDGGVPVVMIELAAVTAAPDVAPTDLAHGPPVETPAETTPPPPETPPAETAPADEAVRDPDPPPPDPSPVTLPHEAPPAPPKPPEAAADEPPVATAPPSAAAPSPKPAAAAAGTRTQAAPATIARWQTRLLALLHRHKRYPAAAGGRTGVTRVAFTIDREGRLQRRTIATSSGSDALDAEALALIDRAAPFPPPPAELPDAALSFVVPIRFTASGG